jgi:hypothetical protein
MRSHRPRRLVPFTAALLVGLALLWGPAALAQSPDRVTFTGGCDDPSTSTTEPERITVPPGGTVELVNGFAVAGVLSLDGEAAAELPAGGSVAIVVHRGPVTATLRAACPTGELASSRVIALSEEPGRDEAGRGEAGRDEAGRGAPDLVSGEQLLPWLGAPRPSSPPTIAPDRSGVDDTTDTTDAGDAAGAQTARSAGSDGGSVAQALLAVIATFCVLGASAIAIRELTLRRTAPAYHA